MVFQWRFFEMSTKPCLGACEVTAYRLQSSVIVEEERRAFCVFYFRKVIDNQRYDLYACFMKKQNHLAMSARNLKKTNSSFSGTLLVAIGAISAFSEKNVNFKKLYPPGTLKLDWGRLSRLEGSDSESSDSVRMDFLFSNDSSHRKKTQTDEAIWCVLIYVSIWLFALFVYLYLVYLSLTKPNI